MAVLILRSISLSPEVGYRQLVRLFSVGLVYSVEVPVLVEFLRI